MEIPSAPLPLCFVLMPFGVKTDARGRTTNFDAVYRQIIAPAVAAAEMEPLRADEEKIGGTIHKPMFERLMLCQYAIADITGANPNVYYELGIRHALRPRSTVILFAEGTTLPFDIAQLRGMPYKLSDGGEPLDVESCSKVLAAQLREVRTNPHDDSPLFQLIADMPRFEIDHIKTDAFRKIFDYSRKYKDRLAEATRKGAAAVNAIAAEPGLANLNEVETGVVVDLFLSLRDVENHKGMIELYQRMPPPLQRARTIRELLAFALNREGQKQEAADVLELVIKEFGPSSETYGLLGRVYKDRWEEARKSAKYEAAGLLEKAIETYVAGFQSDWRDAYPGVNALTLMEGLDDPDPRRDEMLPVVHYAVRQKAQKSAGYWDFATLLEIAVLAKDPKDANKQLGKALAIVDPKGPWQLDSTVKNLKLIRDLRTSRGEDAGWVKEIEEAMESKAAALRKAQKS